MSYSLIYNFKDECSAYKLVQIKGDRHEIFYNHVHNILRHFDVWPSFPFTTSETKRDYYYIRDV